MISQFQKLLSGRETLAKGEHFSYREIPAGEICLVPSEQEMLLTHSLVIEGEIQIEGQITLDEFFDALQVPENFSYQLVSDVVILPAGQQMIVADQILIDGELRLEGELLLEDFLIADEFIDVDVVYPENFSFRNVVGITEVPVDQQMIVTDGVLVDGELRVEGELILDELADENNFSQQKVVSISRIPDNQQMIVDGEIDIEGELQLEGELSLLGEVEDDFIPWYEIPDKKVIQIKQYREYFLSQYLALEGTLEIEGRLVIGA